MQLNLANPFSVSFTELCSGAFLNQILLHREGFIYFLRRCNKIFARFSWVHDIHPPLGGSIKCPRAEVGPAAMAIELSDSPTARGHTLCPRAVGAPARWAGVNFPRVSNLQLSISVSYSSNWIGLWSWLQSVWRKEVHFTRWNGMSDFFLHFLQFFRKGDLQTVYTVEKSS